jgi:hypothetical protein
MKFPFAFFKFPFINLIFPFTFFRFPLGNGLLSVRNDEKLTGKAVFLKKKKEKKAI